MARGERQRSSRADQQRSPLAPPRPRAAARGRRRQTRAAGGCSPASPARARARPRPASALSSSSPAATNQSGVSRSSPCSTSSVLTNACTSSSGIGAGLVSVSGQGYQAGSDVTGHILRDQQNDLTSQLTGVGCLVVMAARNPSRPSGAPARSLGRAAPASALDTALANGTPSEADAALALRARRLTNLPRRRELALAIRHLVREADRAGAPSRMRASPLSERVSAAREELAMLAEKLGRAGTGLRPRGRRSPCSCSPTEQDLCTTRTAKPACATKPRAPWPT